MTLTILCLLVASGHKPRFAGHWPEGLAKHAKIVKQQPPGVLQIASPLMGSPALKNSGSSSLGQSGQGGAVTADSVHLTPEEMQTLRAGLAEMGERRQKAEAAIADWRPRDAIAALTEPGKYFHGILGPTLMFDAYIRMDDLKDAYDLMALVARAESGKFSDDEEMLRASLIAALRGEVYEGQREAVVKRFGESEYTKYGLTGYSSKTIVLLSLLRLVTDSMLTGDDPSRYYYSVKAFQMAPSNPLVALGYAELMHKMGHCREAMRALKGIESRVVGFDRTLLLSQEHDAEWWIERPDRKAPYTLHMRDPIPDLP
jgi:hypothetical protein